MIRVIDADLKISVPAWMLDQSVCSSMAIEGIAMIALSSLRDLRESVDLQLAAISANNIGSQIASGEPDGQAAPATPPADA